MQQLGVILVPIAWMALGAVFAYFYWLMREVGREKHKPGVRPTDRGHAAHGDDAER